MRPGVTATRLRIIVKLSLFIKFHVIDPRRYGSRLSVVLLLFAIAGGNRLVLLVPVQDVTKYSEGRGGSYVRMLWRDAGRLLYSDCPSS